MEKTLTYVGLDVHKDTIAVTLAESGMRSDVRELWQDHEYPNCVEDAVCKAG